MLQLVGGRWWVAHGGHGDGDNNMVLITMKTQKLSMTTDIADSSIIRKKCWSLECNIYA